MLAIPAVDIRAGSCVQLVGGDFNNEVLRREDPLVVVRDWMDAGYSRLHLIDLDAATGRSRNDDTIRAILRECPVPVQVGGGVRDEDDIERLLDWGAAWVISGSRAVDDAHWREQVCTRYPERIIVAADVRDRRVVTNGWTRASAYDLIDLMNELRDLPLAGVLITDVENEGKLAGTNLPLVEDAVESVSLPVIASGGISSLDDLRALEHRGVSAAVLGMALYTGAIDARRAAREFGA